MKNVFLCVLTVFACFAAQVRCEDRPDKLKTLFQVEQWGLYGVALGDAGSTSYQIRHGYVEGNGFDNLFIDRSKPAFAERSALVVSESLGINFALGRAWRSCGKSKSCKVAILGAEGFFVGQRAHGIVHNVRIK